METRSGTSQRRVTLRSATDRSQTITWTTRACNMPRTHRKAARTPTPQPPSSIPTHNRPARRVSHTLIHLHHRRTRQRGGLRTTHHRLHRHQGQRKRRCPLHHHHRDRCHPHQRRTRSNHLPLPRHLLYQRGSSHRPRPHHRRGCRTSHCLRPRHFRGRGRRTPHRHHHHHSEDKRHLHSKHQRP
jgi:hypothetical protein